MKFFEKFTIFFITLIVIFTSCKKRELIPDVGPVDIKVKIVYESSIEGYKFPLKGVKVRLLNQWNNRESNAVSDEDGVVEFLNKSAGAYNFNGTITIPKDQYNFLTGLDVEEDITLNASFSKTLNHTLDSTIKLEMNGGRVGDLVIKQIYYAGSHTTNGASFRDQFVEIYNNSNKVIYADSLYIGQIMGSNTVNPNLSTGFFITSGPMVGQYNWNKSIGMPTSINANDNYIYVRSLYRIPGNGTQYPILPGASIVLAQTAVNHKAPYSNSTGGTVAIKDPSLTVDLSQADFEVYLAPYLSVPLASDIDNPAVPDLIMLDYTGKDWLFDNPGREGLAIFKTDIDIPSTFKKYPDPTVLAIVANTTIYYQIPSNLIIDAVEIQPNTLSARVPKRLTGKFDAGYAYVPAGAYSSQSLIRKTVKVVDGRKILMDTNNSTNDFDYLDRALPKAFK